MFQKIEDKMTNQITTIMKFDEIERLAGYMAKSNLFGIKTPEQAVSLMALSQAEGLHPAIAARDYHIVQGRPTLKADAMLSRFQQAGGKVEWKEYADKVVTGVFTHPQGGKVEISWTIEMAVNANLTNKEVWRQYPRQMLRARVISEGIRTIYPGVAVGIYTPEEAQDFAPEPEIKDITPEAKSLFKTATARKNWAESVISAITACESIRELKSVADEHKPRLEELIANGNDYDVQTVEELRKRLRQHQERLKEKAELNQERNYLDEAFNHAIQDYEMPPENSVVGSEAAMVQEGALSRVDSAEPPASKKPDRVAVPVVNGLTDWEGWVALLQEKELPQLKTKRDAALFRKKYESQIGNLAKADNALYFQLEGKLQGITNAAV